MSHEPLYRPVLRDAFQAAWRERRAWIVALCAGLLLSGSVYDALWRMMNAFTPRASLPATIAVFWTQAASSWSNIRFADVVIGGIQIFQLSAFLLIVAFAVISFSVICQGALTFLLGSGRSQALTLKQSLTIGARAFWPVLVLNILALAVLLASRSLLAISVTIASSAGTLATGLLYVVAFIAFTLLVTVAVILQIFTLNAMILQGASLAQGLQRAAQLLHRHWIIAFETALILFLISLGGWAMAIIAEGVLAIPLFVLFFVGLSLGSSQLFATAIILMVLLFFAILAVIAGWMVTLHYATWTFLYRRLGEGGAIPKVHRWVRNLTGGYHVPGA